MEWFAYTCVNIKSVLCKCIHQMWDYCLRSIFDNFFKVQEHDIPWNFLACISGVLFTNIIDFMNFESISFHFPLYLDFKEDSISEYIKVNNSSAFMILNAKAVYINAFHWEILCFIQNVILSRISGELQIWTTKMFLKTPFCLVLYSTISNFLHSPSCMFFV